MKDRLDYVSVAADGRNRRAETLAQFEEFLGQVPAGKPFFLQLCWSDPHRPLTDEDLPHKHDPAKITLPPFYPDAPPLRKCSPPTTTRSAGWTATSARSSRSSSSAGSPKNTIVIFMGDNGASQLRGKGTLNEFGIRVPLIIRWPGVVKPGSTSDAAHLAAKTSRRRSSRPRASRPAGRTSPASASSRCSRANRPQPPAAK